MDETVPLGSPAYGIMLALLLFSRGMDLFSTWMATPRLVLEGNPIAKKLGWKWGILLNLGICLSFARWPLLAVVLSTTSVLVAARNFHSAWLMRTLGEEEYRAWFVAQLCRVRLPLFFICLLGETGLVALVGTALISFTRRLLTMAIGMGIVCYAGVVLFYTLLSLWRIRRKIG